MLLKTRNSPNRNIYLSCKMFCVKEKRLMCSSEIEIVCSALELY